MTACCTKDVIAKHTYNPDGSLKSSLYLDLRVDPPTVLDKAAYDALAKVMCPTIEPESKDVCLQPIGNTDLSLVVSGNRTAVKTVNYSDMDGAVASVATSGITLTLEDGTDVTATHEVTECPETIVVETGACIAP